MTGTCVSHSGVTPVPVIHVGSTPSDHSSRYWSPGGGGGGVLAPSFGSHCEMGPESGGGESSDRPIPLNSGVVGHL